MHCKNIYLLLIAGTFYASISNADPIIFNSESSFLSSAGAVSMESFETAVAPNTFVFGASVTLDDMTVSLASGDPVLGSAGGGVRSIPWSTVQATDGTNFFINSTGGGGLKGLSIVFDSPVTQFGISITGLPLLTTSDLLYSTDTGESGSAASPAGANEQFFGLIDTDNAFSSIVFTSNSSSLQYGLDEIYYSSLIPTASGPFSIAVIPDTQMYVEKFPAIFEAQVDWIVTNKDTENIIYVAHLGDLKDDGACDNKMIASPSLAGARSEWEIVDDTLSLLETANIPFGVVPGNHDFEQVGNGCLKTDNPGDRDLTTYDSLFGTRFVGRPYYGGSRNAGSNEDNFTLFEFGGIKFISINLAFRFDANPSNPELIWANDLLQNQYPDRIGIVTSHSFMLCNNNPARQGCERATALNTNGNYGQQVYDSLSGNPNLLMMLSAHDFGEAWRVENRSGMQPVHIILSDYQQMRYPIPGTTPLGDPSRTDPATFSTITGNFTFGNTGFMRIMRFDPVTQMVNINTFAPAMPAAPAVAGGAGVFGTDNVNVRDFDLVSTYFPADGTGMHESSASNLSFSFAGYVTLP